MMSARAQFLLTLPKDHSARNKNIFDHALQMARFAAAQAYAPEGAKASGGAAAVVRIPLDSRKKSFRYEVFHGCDVGKTGEETFCAAANAIAAAVTHGKALNKPCFLDFIVLSDRTDAKAENPVPSPLPESCRYVINEFSGKNTALFFDDNAGGAQMRAEALMPDAEKVRPEYNLTAPVQTPVSAPWIESTAFVNSAAHDLVWLAREMAWNSYAPYDGIRMSAIVTTDSSRAYAGVRVESRNPNWTIGAVEAALTRAVIEEKMKPGRSRPLKSVTIAYDETFEGKPLALERLFDGNLLEAFVLPQTKIIVQEPSRQAAFTYGEWKRGDFRL